MMYLYFLLSLRSFQVETHSGLTFALVELMAGLASCSGQAAPDHLLISPLAWFMNHQVLTGRVSGKGEGVGLTRIATGKKTS